MSQERTRVPALLLTAVAAIGYTAGGYFLNERETFDDSQNDRSNNLAQAARALESVPTDPNQAQLALDAAANTIGDEGAVDDLLRQIAQIVREKQLPPTATDNYQLGLIKEDLEAKSDDARSAPQASTVEIGMLFGFGTFSLALAGYYAADEVNTRRQKKARTATR